MVARRPCTFRQSDLTRALKAARAAGIGIARIEIENGKIIVVAGDLKEPEPEARAENEWDRT
jgi:hypothetical protein